MLFVISLDYRKKIRIFFFCLEFFGQTINAVVNFFQMCRFIIILFLKPFLALTQFSVALAGYRSRTDTSLTLPFKH